MLKICESCLFVASAATLFTAAMVHCCAVVPACGSSCGRSAGLLLLQHLQHHCWQACLLSQRAESAGAAGGRVT
jgi:hypothetical protein